jgi:hypothetical protein
MNAGAPGTSDLYFTVEKKILSISNWHLGKNVSLEERRNKL